MHSRSDSLSPYYPIHISATGTALPLGANVATTSATTITAGSNVTVTPASMTNILQGMRLNFSGGTGTAEDVIVKSVNAVAGTFTADFVNNHSGAYNIISYRPTYFGTLVVNAAGTTSNFTLYNGSPNLYAGGTGTGVVIATITAVSTTTPYIYNCYLNRGLFYTYTAGAAGSFTFMVLDDNIL